MTLNEDWMPPSGDTPFSAGSIISYDLTEWKQDPLHARPTLVFKPGPRQALSGFTATRNLLILTILDNVQSRAFVYKYHQGAWQVTPIPLPENATVGLAAASHGSQYARLSAEAQLSKNPCFSAVRDRG